MRRIVMIMVVIIAIFVAISIAILNTPTRWFYDMVPADVTDIDDARLGKGNIWLQPHNMSRVFNVKWHWCPSMNVLRWCIDIQDHALDISFEYFANFNVIAMAEQLKIRNLDMKINDVGSLHPVGGVLKADLLLNVAELEVSSLTCPQENIEVFRGQGEVQNIAIMGSAFDDVQLGIEMNAGELLIPFQNNDLSGRLSLKDNYYQFNTQLTAPSGMEAMLKTLAKPLGDGRYEVVLQGNIPCNTTN